jgi:hypothetical protein
VVGLLLRAVWYWWLGDSGAPGNVVIGMAVVSAAVNHDSNLALMVGGVVHALIFYGALDYVIRTYRGPRWAHLRGLVRASSRRGQTRRDFPAEHPTPAP